MSTTQLHTSEKLGQVLCDISASNEVRVPIHPDLTPIVKKKQTVVRGQVLAENRRSSAWSTGFAHASIDGLIESVDAGCITIIPQSTSLNEDSPEAPTPCQDLEKLMGEDLSRKLLELGIDTKRFHPSRELVINALNPEPGVLVSEQLLRDAQETLERGLQVLERAITPASITLAVAPGQNISLYGCTTTEVSDCYPYTLNALVLAVVSGAERPANTDCVSLQDVYRVGRVAETGLPLTEAVLCVAGKVVRAPTGMPVRDLLQALDQPVDESWKFALGGPLRGEILFDLSRGIPENCTAISFAPKNICSDPKDAPCIQCGECVLVCPARINPSMLSRYAEFAMYAEAKKRHIQACLHCGMCTFVCPAHRPVMQFIHMAQDKIEEQDSFLSGCRLE